MVPGTDLRSIPQGSPIAPIGDMSAVEATGGKGSDIGEGEGGMDEELMTLIEEIGPENVKKILNAVRGKMEKLDAAVQAAGSAGPQGALSGALGGGGQMAAPGGL